MKQRLNHQAKLDAAAQQQQQAHQDQMAAPREFQSTEEMLRWDAANTPVPPSLDERVLRSINREPGALPPKPWWKRWFS